MIVYVFKAPLEDSYAIWINNCLWQLLNKIAVTAGD